MSCGPCTDTLKPFQAIIQSFNLRSPLVPQALFCIQVAKYNTWNRLCNLICLAGFNSGLGSQTDESQTATVQQWFGIKHLWLCLCFGCLFGGRGRDSEGRRGPVWSSESSLQSRSHPVLVCKVNAIITNHKLLIVLISAMSWMLNYSVMMRPRTTSSAHTIMIMSVA